MTWTPPSSETLATMQDEEGDSAWEDLKVLCGAISRSEFYAHIRALRNAATPVVWDKPDAPDDVVPADAPSKSIAFLPSPHPHACWLAGRLGVDVAASAWQPAPLEGVRVRAAVLGGSAMSADTYARYPADFPRATLVIVDPPFGLDSGPAWDKSDMRWTASNVTTALNHLKRGSHLSDTCLVVAVYCREEDLHDFEVELKDWDSQTAKRLLRLYMARDGTHHMVPGSPGGGARVALLVVQYHAADLKVEDTGLGARCLYSFRPPHRRSKYGRHEIDARLLNADGSPVNKHQKPVEEYRLLVRMLAQRGSTVVSLCNGTGTGNVAAALEGFDSVGAEVDADQNAVARRRLRVFFHREGVLLRAIAGDEKAVKELDTACSEEGLVEPATVGALPRRKKGAQRHTWRTRAISAMGRRKPVAQSANRGRPCGTAGRLQRLAAHSVGHCAMPGITSRTPPSYIRTVRGPRTVLMFTWVHRPMWPVFPAPHFGPRPTTPP